MEYKDENGNKLYGYSQIDLEKHTKALEDQTKSIRLVVKILGPAVYISLAIAIYVLYILIDTHAITNWAKFIGGC